MPSPLSDLAKKLVLSGPTVDDDVRRLIYRYGQDAVTEAVKRLTARKRGRKKVPDMLELRPFIEEDARVWLNGGDPFAARSNYALAKLIADAGPNVYHSATMQRIERKLGQKPYSREWFTFVAAMQISEIEYPYRRHIDAIKALLAIDPGETWTLVLENTLRKVADFESANGTPPDEITMQEIGERLPPMSAFTVFPSPAPMGLLGRAIGSKNSPNSEGSKTHPN